MSIRAFALGLLVLPALAPAHHGRFFLLTTSFDMGHPGQHLWLMDAASLRFNQRFSTELSPGYYMALGNDSRAGLELHLHFGKEGSDPLQFEAVGAEYRHLLGKHNGWGHAVGLEYEGARSGAEEPSNVSARYIVGTVSGSYMFMANIIASRPVSGADKDTVLSYSAGIGKRMSDHVSWGLEVAGGFKKTDAQEAIPELIFATKGGGLFKAGIGVAMNAYGPDVTYRFGYVGHLR
ncbi:MAG: hypothetical protein HZC36_13180 [Armatimonadetes bacterium]|nr:hypothetical protein [Armatimonadota bacterium]